MQKKVQVSVISVLETLRLAGMVPRWFRYILAVLSVFVCLALGQIGNAALYAPFVIFMPAVLFSSILFDRGSGLVATATGAIVVAYSLLPPYNIFDLHNAGQITGLALFVLTGSLTAVFVEALHKTVEDMARKNSLLEAVMQGSPDAIFVKDLRGRYVLANSAMRRIIGASKEDIQEKTDRELMPSHVAEKLEKTDYDVIHNGRVRVEEEELMKAGDNPHMILTTKAPWYGPKGKIIGLIGIAREIEHS